MSDELKTHQFEYRYKGATYLLEIVSDSEEEAKGRVKAAARSKYLGVQAGVIPADGPMPPFLPSNRLGVFRPQHSDSNQLEN